MGTQPGLRLVFVCTDVVGTRMAGPGIRYWELAHELAKRHQVTLVAPGLDVASETVRLLRMGEQSWAATVRDADAVITQYVTPPLVTALQTANVRLVIDAYVPMVLEGLQQQSAGTRQVRRARARTLGAVQALSLLAADAVICASEQQRDLWLGNLMALGRLTPEVYDEDASLRAVIDVVPFGLSATPPVRTTPGPRETFALPDDAVVALWGGGMWEWFDPTTVVEAVALVQRHDPRLHLVLLGRQHPQPGSADSGAGARAVARAEELGLLGRVVHVGPGWLPYGERASWLLDADIGVSAHLDVAENRYAFRTRVLDYLWAGLPCVLTAGDALADLAVQEGFGTVAAVGDVPGWALRLAEMVGDAGLRARTAEAATRSAERFRWDRVAIDLERVLARIAPRAPRRWTAAQTGAATRYLSHGAVGVLLDEGVEGVRRRLGSGAPGQRPGRA